MPSKITIVGAGAWGTTLALLLAEKGHKISLWAFEKEVTQQINEYHENKIYLPGVSLPANVEPTNSEKAIEGAEIVVWAVPSSHIRGILQRFKPFYNSNAISVSVIKGFEEKSHKTISQVIREELSTERIVAVSGPNLSSEIAAGKPAATVAGSKDLNLANTIQSIFNSDKFRVYTHEDITGVEIGGALKNIIALAAGIVDGLELGNNAKAAMMIRGMVEITKLGVALGAKKDTFWGLSGLGDLITTCNSKFSRNHHVGQELSKGKRLKDILSGMKAVAEGVNTTKITMEIAKMQKIEMPITEEVYNVLFLSKKPLDAVNALMQRDPKKENY